MHTPTAEPLDQQHLRVNAEARLKAGTAPSSSGWTVSVDALTLLHRLASNTSSADDALKLLHELQVHQVELDLQHAQLEANERELAGDLARYKSFYDLAPVGYLILDSEGAIVEVNHAAAVLFEMGVNALAGHHIDDVVRTESRTAILDLLKPLVNSGSRQVCEVQTLAGSNSCRLQFAATVSAADGSFLVTVSPCT